MADNDKAVTSTRNVDDFLATARKRFAAAAEDEKDLREKFISDLKFASPDGDEQWDPAVKAQRIQAGRPAMSFPRCHTFVQQVSNEARQNKPQIKFAQGDNGDEETAEIMEGLARHIQYGSDAQVAYETAIEYSAGASFGHYRILTDYCDDDTEDQEIKIVPVLDPLTVYGVLVPAIFGRKPKFWFVVEDVPREEYEAQYPDSEISSLSWTDAQRRGDGWIGSDSVRIAEYWWVEEEKVKGKRRPQVTIKFCKTNGIEILNGEDGETSETVWLGTRCNIIPVLGKQMIVEGKPKLFSVVRPQKAAQQLINYSKSRIAETLAQSPVSPFMITNGQVKGFEKEWATLNTVPRPFLTYNAEDVNGKPAPPPQRQVYEPPIAALSSFVAQEVDDMKATTGIFDASLGSKSNETTGKAIMARQQQANLSVMHFMDNLERSFKQAGEVIGELIPKIYDGARVIEILGADEAKKIVKINEAHQDEKGKPHHYDLSAAKGSWVITMGRSFSSKRMESFDMMQGILQGQPGLLNVIGDIFFQNSDLAGSDQLAERFKKMLPPQLQDHEDGQEIPPQAQAQIAELSQQVMALNEACKIREQENQQLQMEKQAKVIDNQSKMAIEKMKIEAELAVAEITTKAQALNERLAFVEDLAKQFHTQAHQQAMAAQSHEQAKELADQSTEFARLERI